MENTSIDWDKHIDRLVDVRDSIPMHKLTILTGGNGRGKSFLRKVLWQHINKELGINKSTSLVADCSMERRTGLHGDMGGMGVALRDWETTPTSMNTYDFIKNMLNGSDRYFVIDEPEIGMSEETQLGLINYLNKIKDDILSRSYGLLIITHSRTIVSNLDSDCFLNIEGMTQVEWLNRPILAVDLEKVEQDSLDLFIAIRDRLNKYQKKQ